MFRSMNSYASSLHLRVLAWPIRIPDAASHHGSTERSVSLDWGLWKGVEICIQLRGYHEEAAHTLPDRRKHSELSHLKRSFSLWVHHSSCIVKAYISPFYQASLCLPSSSGCRGSPSSMDGGWGGTVSFSWVDLNLNWLYSYKGRSI